MFYWLFDWFRPKAAPDRSGSCPVVRHGICLEWAPDVSERLDRLTRLNGTYSRPETIRRALAVYECLLRRMADEDTVPVLVYPDRTCREVEIK